MPYKPKFCCQCGEKIDRIDWQPWKSRRFCELCETEFGIYDKMRWAVVGIAVLFGLYGTGSYFRKPEKQLNIAASQFAAPTANAEVKQPKTVAQVSNISDVQTPVQLSNFNAQTKATTAPTTANLKIKPAVTRAVEPAERTYFCGAPTKKGTMCSRRVKTANRCWQHEGQAALLPQEKLIAAQ